MKTTMLAAAAALSLGLGVVVAACTQSIPLPGVLAETHRAEYGDWAQLTTRQTGNIELAYVTTTNGESSQQWNQNEGVGG
jgi:hypothetical protein